MSRRSDTRIFRTWEKYLRKINVFPLKNEVLTPYIIIRRSATKIIMSSIVLIGLLGHAYKSMKDRQWSELANDIFLLNIFTIVGGFCIQYLFFGIKLYNLISELSMPKHGLPKDFMKLRNIIDKMTVFVFYYVVVLGFINAANSYFWEKSCDSRQHLSPNDNEGYICGTPFPTWYPVNFNIIPWKQIVFVVNYILVFYYAPIYATGFIIPSSLVAFIVNRVDHLMEYLKTINLYGNDPTMEKKKLRLCMEYYLDISKMVQQLNDTVGLMFAPSQNGLVAACIALLQYQTIVDKSPKALVELIFWLFFEAAVCYSGQELEDAIDRLKNQVYDLSWYDMNPHMRTDFKIFHMQVQKSLHFKIKPNIQINMMYYYKVMKGSYSFLMYLKRF